MKTIDKSRFKLPPAHAEGHFCIELKDPDTGKIKEKVQGQNHVFPDALFSQTSTWQSAVSSVYMVLSDDDTAVDNNFPYMLGNVVGYGVPSAGSSGNYRGAYNTTNQVLASMTPDMCRWKFQYDFTTAQANGTIKSIGLTNQYFTPGIYPLSAYKLPGSGSSYCYLTCDGRYTYSCSTAGIITKHDLYTNTSATIDVSATVGTSSSVYKDVGYAPNTGKYYILTFSSTASDRHMYVFSNNTFSSLETTYTTSNIDSAILYNYPMYIYGNFVFWIYNNEILYVDFVNNATFITASCSITDVINSTSSITGLHTSSCAFEKYIICGYYSSGIMCIFDMSLQQFVGRGVFPYNTQSIPLFKYPLIDVALFCTYTSCYHNAAIAKQVLSTPVTKTSSYGMTATYELEVDW